MKTWMDYEELSTKESLIRLLDEEKSPTRLARRIGCTVTSVKSAMRHYGVRTKKYAVSDDQRKRLNL